MPNASDARCRQYVTDKRNLVTLVVRDISGARIIDAFGYRACP